jgi:hypothetical protein
MPRLEFRFSKTDSILWTFDRHPEIGEEVVLGDRGVFRVIERSEPGVPDPGVDAEYLCERVRDATPEDLDAMLKRGPAYLPRR